MRSTRDARTTERTPPAVATGPASRPGALSFDASPRAAAQCRQILSAFGQVAQRAISLGALTAKLQEVKHDGGSYHGTLDDNTSPDVANAVGGQWVAEEAAATSTYYGASAWDSKVSATGERQYRPPMMKLSGQAEGSAQANYVAEPLPARGYLIVPAYDYAKIHAAISRLCDQATGPDWPALAARLNLDGRWEYGADH